MDTVATQDQESDSAEFIGLARRLHDKLVVAAKLSSPMMAAVRADIIKTARRNHGRQWDRRYLLDVEQKWRAIPANERLHLYIKRTRTALLILDVRVGSTVVANSQWEDGGQETDLIIVGNRIVMRAFDLECASAPMATVSVRHALSKRYRRGFNNSDESVMADLAVLAQHQMPDAPTPRVSVTSPSGGLWCGDVMRFHDIDGVESLILAVRTFRSADRFY